MAGGERIELSRFGSEPTILPLYEPPVINGSPTRPRTGFPALRGQNPYQPRRWGRKIFVLSQTAASFSVKEGMKNNVLKRISDSNFTQIVAASRNYSDICRKLGLRVQGSNFRVLKRKILCLNISISHFSVGCPVGLRSNPLNKILVENSDYQSSLLRKRLLREGLLKNVCLKCGNNGEWMGEKITLQLDHINGDRRDNRLENLRILCPNCHTQTKTHSGKRLKKIYICPCCKSIYNGYGKLCIKCFKEKRKEDAAISIEDIKEELWKIPATHIAKKFGVTSVYIKKLCKVYGIETPPRGYWTAIIKNGAATGTQTRPTTMAKSCASPHTLTA